VSKVSQKCVESIDFNFIIHSDATSWAAFGSTRIVTTIQLCYLLKDLTCKGCDFDDVTMKDHQEIILMLLEMPFIKLLVDVEGT
jgi:hypothetical protein